MKNIVMIHLESLNKDLLFHSMEAFPNIKRFIAEGIYFNNYWSTATSTIMAMSDNVYGCHECSDRSSDLVHFNLEKNAVKWMDKLGGGQISGSCMIYPCFDWRYDTINVRAILKDNIEISQYSSDKVFWEDISQYIGEMNGSFLYVCDWTSVCTRQHLHKRGGTWNDYYRQLYKHIDDTVGYVYSALEKAGKLDNTIIVLYGDHGDDMYSYGLKKGFTHAIEPFPKLIGTPLIVYQAGIHRRDPGLVCTYDIGNIVKALLSGKEININRKYVFSRNLFPSQNSDLLNKGFSVTNGEYLFLITQYGMELYNCSFISLSSFNLLNWFVLKRDGKIDVRKNEGLHFQRFILNQQNDIAHNFEVLRRKMYTELQSLIGKELLGRDSLRWFRKIRYDKWQRSIQ